MTSKIMQIINESSNIKTFWLKPSQKIHFLAGQFAEFSIYNGNDYTTRTFSISSAPSEELIAFTTKFYKKSSDYKNKLKKLEISDEIYISEPMGDFVLPKNKKLNLMFIAGGIGITPFRSIFRELNITNQKRSITLLQVVNERSNILFDEEFKLNSLNRIIITKDKLKTINKKLEQLVTTNDLFYISGSTKFVSLIYDYLITYKVNKQKIIRDDFF